MENIVTITENDRCVELLRKIAPDLIDKMPAAAMTAPEGKSTIIHQGVFNPELKKGLLVVYFGAGCDEGDNGWALTFFKAYSKKEFDKKFKFLVSAMKGACG